MMRRLQDMRLRTKLFGALSFLLLMILALETIIYQISLAEQDATEAIDQGQSIIEELNDVQWYLSQMQTSYRSYMMTGDSSFVAEYNVAVQQFEIALDRLEQTVLLNPPEFGRLVTIEDGAHDWRYEILEPGIELRDAANNGTANPDAPLAYLQETPSLTAYQEVADDAQAALSNQYVVMEENKRDVASLQRLERNVMVGSTAIIAGLIVVLALGLSRDVVGAVSQLRSQAQRIASGDLHARINPVRRDEIGQAAVAFDDMADRLERMAADLKNAAAMAQEREQRIRTIVDNVGEGLISFIANGAISSINPAAKSMFGVEEASIIGTCITDLLQSGDLSDLISIHDLIPESAGDTRINRTVYGKRLDGSLFPLEVTVREIPDGEQREFMSVLRDISERRNVERRLQEQLRAAREAETLTHAVLDATNDAIAVASDDAVTLIANQRFADFFQVMQQEVIGLHTIEALEAAREIVSDFDQLSRLVLRGMANPDEHVSDIVKLVWPREAVLEYSSLPVIAANGDRLGRLYAFHDITHQREVDRMKNEFVSLVSHELRTPLTSIKGYVDLLLDQEVGGLNDDQREFLKVVGSNARRLVDMVNELLDISRIEAGKIELRIEPLDLVEMVQKVVAGLSPLSAQKSQTVTIHACSGLPLVPGDHDRLVQVMTNLVSNALNYTPMGGRITISLRVEGDLMIVDVADTGVGLDEDELRQLFTRFFRAKNRTTREVAGSGLGLSITRTLIEMHGGAISVESIPGEGSTFTVTLPLAEDAIKSPLPAPNAPEPLLEAPELAGGGKILLVEGDAEIANLIAHHLRRSGQTVMVAPDAATAIEMSRSEHFDLVTLDVVLPDQDGFSVLQAILETPAHDDVPVMMLSILPDDGTGTALGALDYVAKPVQEQELTERVSRILQADRAHSFLIADDDDLRDVLASEVRRLGHRVIEARDGREALEKILEHEIDLALLDVEMPGESGIEVLQAIRRMPATRHLAVIMMTGVDHVLSTGGRDPGSAHGGQMVARTLSPRDIASIVDRAVEAQAVHRA